MAQPRIGALGLLSAVYFAFASNIDNVMTFNAVAFLNSSLAILVGIAVAVVLFSTFFPETPAYAGRRFLRQLVVHLSSLISARGGSQSLRCYQGPLFEQLGNTLARVQDEPKVAHECLASGVAALSAAQAIGRLKNSLDANVLPPGIAAKSSRLLVRLSQTLHNPSALKFGRRAAEAHALSRDAFATYRGSAAAKETRALRGVIVGAATLATDLKRARMVLKGESDAIPI